MSGEWTEEQQDLAEHYGFTSAGLRIVDLLAAHRRAMELLERVVDSDPLEYEGRLEARITLSIDGLDAIRAFVAEWRGEPDAR